MLLRDELVVAIDALWEEKVSSNCVQAVLFEAKVPTVDTDARLPDRDLGNSRRMFVERWKKSGGITTGCVCGGGVGACGD